jgi:flagellar assembly protein FliH
MQSLSNIIKSEVVLRSRFVKVDTDYSFEKEKNELYNKDLQEENSDHQVNRDSNEFLKKYENIANNLVKEAEENKKKILFDAYLEAENIKRQALEEVRKQAEIIKKEAFDSGYADGREQGEKNAYEEVIPKAKEEAENIVNNAENILLSTKVDYEKYMEDKRNELKDLVVFIAETVLKREVDKNNGINDMIEDAIGECINSKSIVIKVNSLYEEELKNESKKWDYDGEIFIVKDELMDKGHAILKSENSLVKVGIELGMESIKDALQNL